MKCCDAEQERRAALRRVVSKYVLSTQEGLLWEETGAINRFLLLSSLSTCTLLGKQKKALLSAVSTRLQRTQSIRVLCFPFVLVLLYCCFVIRGHTLAAKSYSRLPFVVVGSARSLPGVMGRNKIRTRAVDVTKSLLQPTSVTDRIAVQVGPTTIIQAGEEDLSPTQGSEAAFSLRREGKLDNTMKLCANWRLGNCHSYAACSFAHVTRYFGQAGKSASAATTGRAAVLGGPYSSVAAAGSSARVGGVGGSGAAVVAAAQPDKSSPPSYPAAKWNSSPVRTDERRTTTATSASTAAAAVAAAAVRSPDVPSLPARSQAGEAASAPPTSASTAAIAPVVRPAAADPIPPAVVSAEGLRGILLSLSTTVGAAAAAPAARPATTATTSTERKEGAVNTSSHHPRHFLDAVEAAALQLPTPVWQERPCTTETEIINTIGQIMVGALFDAGRQPVKFWQHIFSINTREQ